jgi:hypothetical protein
VLRLAPRAIFNDDPADRQKAICQEKRAWVDLERELMRRRELVEQACGGRVRWEKCDTACARTQLRKTESEAAYECDPARVGEAVKKDQQEKAKLNEESRRIGETMDGCMHVTMALEKSEASKPEWPAWINACNGNDRDVCTLAWFSLERAGIPTTGLTCRPNEQERARKKRVDDEMNSPEQARQIACLHLTEETGRAPEHDEWVKMCNAASADYCGMTRSIIEDDNKKPNPGLTCAKPKPLLWK